ncbi:hypothetical protein [Mucilaginibacter segetis]|uniref:YXWGXW repeat-containing protein n=1 Tax=Mucilaginibacter segetis TaxID=2793071 RepID=A0A934PST8_9SPHI|nr:hypothetical protein [Mucilaginibacter segetis]MBK0378867.1 hypothetical protein [Mucilaginibacter segetis]
MKKIALLSAILMGGMVYNTANAQISIHIGLNIPTHRVYVPVQTSVPVYNDEFDDSDDYYYLPEVDAYYSIPRRAYFYFDGGRWISAAYLPGAYRDFDWRTARRYEVHARRPYLHAEVYRSRYGGNARYDWGRDNNYANHNNHNYNNNGWGNENRNRYGNNEQSHGVRDRSNYGGQPSHSNGGYNRPDDNRNNHNTGGYGNGQPSQTNRGDGHGNANSQPSNHGHGYGGGQVAQNNSHSARQTGVIRPARF